MQDYQRTLSETVAILNKLNVYWFLEGGTCLGYVREGKVIAHDHDIDIGIYARADQITGILDEFPVHKVFRYNDYPSNVAFYSGAFVDIFFFTDYEGFIVETMHNLYNKTIRLYGYRYDIILGGTKKAMFEGVEVNVLNNSEQYCRTLYGTNYLVPDTNWNAWDHPFNIVSEVALSLDQKSDLVKDEVSESIKIIEDYLATIYFILYRNSRDCFDLSFYNGLSGLALFFFKYAIIRKDSVSFNYAQLLLKRMLDNLKYNKFDLSFLYGYSGIAWMIEYAYQFKLIDGDSQMIMSKINQFIDLSVDNRILTNEELSGIIKYKTLCYSQKDPSISDVLNKKLTTALIVRINKLFDDLDTKLNEYALAALTDLYMLLIQFLAISKVQEDLKPLTLKLQNLYADIGNDQDFLLDANKIYYTVKLLHLLNLDPQQKDNHDKKCLDIYSGGQFLLIKVKENLLKLGNGQKLELVRIVKQSNFFGSHSDELILFLLKDLILNVKDNFGEAFNNDILDGILGLGITLLDELSSSVSTTDFFSGILHTQKRSLSILPIS